MQVLHEDLSPLLLGGGNRVPVGGMASLSLMTTISYDVGRSLRRPLDL
jgi:hypothetical protein